MSATTGIHSGVYGDQTLPWTGWQERKREKAVSRKQSEGEPSSWLWNLGQLVLAVFYTLAMLPIMFVGAFVALVLAAWAILAPALIAGFALVIVSYVIAAF